MSDEMQPNEIFSLSEKLGQAYARRAGYFRDKMGLPPVEAEVKARDVGDLVALQERVRSDPPDQISWWELSALQEHDPEACKIAWERIKALARDEWESGHRAAAASEGFDRGPMERARFLVIRQGMIDEWPPRGAIELTLTDMLAQSYFCYAFWLERLSERATTNASIEEVDLEEQGHWRPSRISEADAYDQAAAMADRFNRIFLRTLRALRDLRRYNPTVSIGKVGQLNIGGGQQLNIAGTSPTRVVRTIADDDPDGGN